MAKASNSSSKSGGNAPALSYKALFFMALLAIQFGIQPIVTKRYTSGNIIKSSVIFMQEVTKLVISAFVISSSGQWADVKKGWSIYSWFGLAFVPAAIYLIQNTCSLLAYQNLDAITYNVLNQTKTLSAAFCCYILMGKKQSNIQIVALLLLLVSALVMEKIVTSDTLTPSYWMQSSESIGVFSSLSGHHFSHGVLPIMVASFLSGLAGAITQKSLQLGNRHSLLFTMELCVASLLILVASFFTSDDGKQIMERGFFDGWTVHTAIPILTNSAGGICVGLVIKHAGTVRKGFALIFGIVLSGAVQSVLDSNKSLSTEEVLGGAIAALSLWMHATHPYASSQSSSAAAKVASIGNQKEAKREKKSRKED